MVAIRHHKDRLENIGLVVMVVGILFLVQPLTVALFTVGFPILLAGLVFYIIVSHF